MTENTINRTAIQRVKWSVLNELWCIPVSATPDTVIAAILEKTAAPVQGDGTLVQDRLYGGWACDDERQRHVYFVTGQYTYLGVNVALTPAERLAMWERLAELNLDGDGFRGGGPFCEDVPPAWGREDHAG